MCRMTTRMSPPESEPREETRWKIYIQRPFVRRRPPGRERERPEQSEEGKKGEADGREQREKGEMMMMQKQCRLYLCVCLYVFRLSE